MSNGAGMIWPLAAEYSRKGWAVRRAGWDDVALLGDSGRSLRWIVYHSGLFHLLFRDPVTFERQTRVVRNTDFSVSEFFAEDWTVHAPDCGTDGSEGGNSDQQGKARYPRTQDTPITVDPRNPNATFGTCPVVPDYLNIRIPS